MRWIYDRHYHQCDFKHTQICYLHLYMTHTNYSYFCILKKCERLYYRAAYRAKECTISVYLKVSVCAVRDYLYYASNGLSLARTNQR